VIREAFAAWPRGGGSLQGRLRSSRRV